MSFILYARGDSSSANNSSVNSQNTSTTPTTELTFGADPDAGSEGDVILEYNDGGSDPDTLLYIDGVATTFTVEFSGFLPDSNKLKDVNGFDMRGEEIVVITDDSTGQRYYMFTNSETLFSSSAEMYATLDDMPNGALAITSVNSTTPVTICFARGSRIETPTGSVKIENLNVGDLVSTDAGPEAITWIGSRQLNAMQLLSLPSLCPIRIKKDAFGVNFPTADVVLSPNHRIKITDWKLQLNFGLESALCPIKHLVDGGAVQRFVPTAGIEYFHLLLASHRTVICEGLESETLFAGKQSLASVSKECRAELLALFAKDFSENGALLVRPELKRTEALLVA
ncbi:MAG: Hint domain-containing protein [Paracoccaceae bacterium]